MDHALAPHCCALTFQSRIVPRCYWVTLLSFRWHVLASAGLSFPLRERTSGQSPGLPMDRSAGVLAGFACADAQSRRDAGAPSDSGEQIVGLGGS